MTDSPSFARNLFLGNINESDLFPFPEVSESERETLPVLIESLRKFLDEEVDSRQIDEEKNIPEAVRNGLGELGILGMTMPEEVGGYGMSQTAYCRVCEELSTTDATLAVFVGGHVSIGTKALTMHGSTEQKERFLSKCATGEWLACFALTEPEAGSDARSMRTTARLSDDGTHYVVNGSKQWITNGSFADIFTVFARVENDGPDGRIACFILTRGMEGFSVGKDDDKLGLRGSSTTPLFFENVKVPVADRLGRVGEAFKIAMNVLNYGRMSLAAGCIGAARRMIKESSMHATQRRQFGQTLAEFEMIKNKFWRMASRTYVLESAVYLTSGLCDRGIEDFQIESAACKTYGSEILWGIVNDALQVAGGNGYMTEFPYERFLRDARINMIFEGTNEIQRLFIAGMGLHDVRKLIKSEERAKTDIAPSGDDVRKIFDRIPVSGAPEALRHEAEMLSELTAILAEKSEFMVRKFGKNVRDHEYLQERIADMFIDLYCLAATVSRVKRSIDLRGEEAVEDEIFIAKSFAREAHHRFLWNAESIENNDDEARSRIADRIMEDTVYPWRYIC